MEGGSAAFGPPARAVAFRGDMLVPEDARSAQDVPDHRPPIAAPAGAIRCAPCAASDGRLDISVASNSKGFIHGHRHRNRGLT
jgi:hypothetical protein